MKTLYFLLVFLMSCGQSNQPAQKSLNVDDDSIEFQSVSITTSSSGIIPSAALDFASLSFRQSATQSLIIQNQSLLPLEISSEEIHTGLLSPFEIVSNGCLSAVPVRKSCSIKLKLSNLSELSEEQILNSSFIIKDAIISLTGTLSPPANTDSLISIVPASLQFGNLIENQHKEVSVIIKNNSPELKNVTIPSPAVSQISLSSNSCTATLAPRKSCTLRFKYLASTDTVAIATPLISIANQTITYSVSVNNPSLANPLILSSIAPVILSAPVSINQPDNYEGTISFRNNGLTDLMGPIDAIASDPSIIISSMSCPDKLARGKTCLVDYEIQSSIAPINLSSQIIKLQSGTNASVSHELDLEIVPEFNALPINWNNKTAGTTDYGLEYGLASTGSGWSNGASSSSPIIGDFEMEFVLRPLGPQHSGSGDTMVGFTTSIQAISIASITAGYAFYLSEGKHFNLYPLSVYIPFDNKAVIGLDLSFKFIRVGSVLTYTVSGPTVPSATLYSGTITSSYSGPLYPMVLFYNYATRIERVILTQ